MSEIEKENSDRTAELLGEVLDKLNKMEEGIQKAESDAMKDRHQGYEQFRIFLAISFIGLGYTQLGSPGMFSAWLFFSTSAYLLVIYPWYKKMLSGSGPHQLFVEPVANILHVKKLLGETKIDEKNGKNPIK
jgi:hypothetical protein